MIESQEAIGEHTSTIMCKNPAFDDEKERKSFGVTSLLANIGTVVYTLGFVNFRFMEIASLVAGYPIQVLSSIAAILIGVKATNKVSWKAIIALSMIAFVLVTDNLILDPIPTLPEKRHTVVVITGSNSGVGFETAKALARLETAQAIAKSSVVTVVMGCRSMTKCEAAAQDIRQSLPDWARKDRVVPFHLDLASFASVFQFAKSIRKTVVGGKVDVLFNNAGYVPTKEETPNAYALDPSFTSMHLSHHLLAELLVKENSQLRLVATSSGTHHICAMPAFLPAILEIGPDCAAGCIDESYLAKNIYSASNPDKYIVAKMANVMHVAEFAKRHPESTSVAIDLGWVGTSIQPWMSGGIITPTNLGWMRSASRGIYPMLQAILMPTLAPNRDWSKEGGLMLDSLGKTREPFYFRQSGEYAANMQHMSKELWNTSSAILRKYGCRTCR